MRTARATISCLTVLVLGVPAMGPTQGFSAGRAVPLSSSNPTGNGAAGVSDAVVRNQATLRIDDVRQLEGSSSLAIFRVRLSGTHGVVRVDYSTSTSGVTATAGEDGCPHNSLVDFESASGYFHEFGPSDSVKDTPIGICDDDLDEPNESFFVILSNAIGATIQDGRGLGTIVDDDPTPSLSIATNVTVPEAGAQNAAFRVSLSAASGNIVTVFFLTRGGTATGGRFCTGSEFDYRANPDPLRIPPGQPSGTLYVPICDDFLREGNESFQVALSGAINATIRDSIGSAFIIDNDPPPALSIVAPDKTHEGASAVFTVTLSGPQTIQTISVDFATAPGTARAGVTCLDIADYATQSGTLTFARGTTTQLIRVPICADDRSDPNETFGVTLSNPHGATMATSTATATIQ